MCIAYFSLNNHPDWPLIVAANRDEFHQRPTQTAAYWKHDPSLLAGQDLQAGGTWLGLHTQHRRVSLVTNFREPGHTHSYSRSRGQLPLACLENPQATSLEALQSLAAQQKHYAGFNLLSIDLVPNAQTWVAKAAYLSNRANAPAQTLADGIHVLSNHLLNTAWPKSDYLREHTLAQGFDGSPAAIAHLFTILRTDQAAPDHLLPSTGLSLERERLLSSPFIISPEYGTRCSTIIAVNAQGQGMFIERSFTPQAQLLAQNDWYFQLQAP
ncbi:NRDE family protein [Alcaligenes endophyticus]|uniref:NRDE family protein n=1 Tax=Alcaligenes endophyticus TaxID=1929088 RepID=A0ABT8EJV4_9BURK|nr:NRDE family protein [Alcaligenes endophyticus]MCX5591890.1 NRDE family protein [Alcaligenes endophyticus]MDN4121579.1 NRDE family protein [Alcaligenes endophyticus]